MSRPSRKRFKKSHGPDFVENFDSAIFEELDSINRCDYCNRNGKQEDLLICKDCNAKAHPTCMDYSPELARRSRMSPWQCIDCKTCCICEEAEDADCMLFCDLCDKGYHENCHKPKISEKPHGKWVCQKCQDDPEPSAKVTEKTDGIYGINITNVISLKKNESQKQDAVMDTNELGMNQCTIDGASGLPTPCDSPVPETQEIKQSLGTTSLRVNKNFFKNKENVSMASVPDATEWSIEDVEKYFCSIGFSDQAKAFGEQEIDGKSLLLMKRNDVLTGLALKLGPALKIYNYVKRLQLKHVDDSDDF